MSRSATSSKKAKAAKPGQAATRRKRRRPERPAASANGAAARPRHRRCGRAAASSPRSISARTKICCFIARVEDGRAADHRHRPPAVARHARRGDRRSRRGQRGRSCSAVHAAEEMAGETIERVVVNLSGGISAPASSRPRSTLGRREIGDTDMRHVLERGYLMREPGDRQVIHSIPVGFSIDDSRGIRDPRGMFGERLGVNMHIVDRRDGEVRNHAAAVGRSPSRHRGAGRQPLRRGPRLPGRGRDRSWRHRDRHGRRHDDDRRCSSTAT